MNSLGNRYISRAIAIAPLKTYHFQNNHTIAQLNIVKTLNNVEEQSSVVAK